MEKKYYWLKFPKDFFSSKRIKKLRLLAGGDTFTIIYLKMQLKALESEGVLEYTGLEKTFAEEIALDIDEAPENVGITINYLLSCGLMEVMDESHMFMPYVKENTASETKWAEKKRTYRRQLEDTTRTIEGHCPTEIDIDKDKEIEIDKEKKKIVAFAPPSVAEVSAYVSEKGYHFDPESFVAFYASKGWMVGNNKMKDWKQACVTWEKRGSKDSANRPSEERKKQYDDFMAEQMNQLLNGSL